MELLFDAVVDDYEVNNRKSEKTTKSRIEQLKKRWGNIKAKSFGPTQIQVHISERQAAGVAPATINRELAIIRRAFKLAMERGQVGSMPKVKALRENNARRGFFSDEEFTRLRSHLPEWMHLLATFAYFTGCRKGELISLKWGQVDGDMVRLGETKNGLPRTVPLTSELVTMFAAAKERATTEYVFEREGNQVLEFTIYKPWDKACEATGLEGRLFHDFRRTGVRNMIRAGVPRHVAMAISGHETDSMFRRYDIVDESDLRQAAELIAKFHKSAK